MADSPQPNLFDWTPAPRYPDAPGYKEDTTSKEAAAKITEDASKLRRRAFAAISTAGAHGLTAHECAAALNRDKLAVSPRVTELFKAKLIKKAPFRRTNESGMSATVWMVT